MRFSARVALAFFSPCQHWVLPERESPCPERERVRFCPYHPLPEGFLAFPERGDLLAARLPAFPPERERVPLPERFLPVPLEWAQAVSVQRRAWPVPPEAWPV